MFRLVPTTSKPASTSASAAAFPIPEDAPVTSATGRFVDIMTPLVLNYDHNIISESRMASGAFGDWRSVVRYGKEHKQETRQRIIQTAGRRFKRDGIDGSGIAALMADAGLTNGAFYAHFASKSDLVATAVADQLGEQRASFSELAPAAPELSSTCVNTFRFSTATTPTTAAFRRPARRDRALHGGNQTGLHRRRAGSHRRRRRPPGTRRSPVGTHEDAQHLRHDGRDAAALPRPGADRQLADQVLEQGHQNALALPAPSAKAEESRG